MDPGLYKTISILEGVTEPTGFGEGSSLAPVSTAPVPPKKSSKAFSPSSSSSDVSVNVAELDQVQTSPAALASGGESGPTDVERGSASAPSEKTPQADSVWNPRINVWRMAAVCSMLFLDGLHDSCAGPLIPFIEVDYGIGYATVSMVFVGTAFGFILGASLLDLLKQHLGRQRALSVTIVLQGLGFLAVALRPPFPVVVVSYAFIGFAFSINIAFSNLFCASLANGTVVLGVMHGSYGIGGTVGPLIATSMAGSGLSWSKYYFIGLGMSVLNFGLATWSFWGADGYGTTGGVASSDPEHVAAEKEDHAGTKPNGLLAALKSKVVALGALFLFSYQGAEVSISGWVVSFLINVRGGAPESTGYVTSGFWGGITLGRFVLANPAQRVGEKLFVYLLAAGSVAFELVVWLVPNLIGDAVAVAVVGILLGPIAPCSAAVFMKTMGRQERASGMGIISALGSSGGAVAPFTTGLLAQAKGTWVMHPVVLGLFLSMIGCWFGLPKTRK